MVRSKTSRTSNLFGRIAICLAIGTGAAILTAGTVVVVTPKSAQATPTFTVQTKLPCTQCHTNAAGGANTLTDFGKKFQDNGNKLPK